MYCKLFPFFAIFWISEISALIPICSLQSTRECSLAAESIQMFTGYKPTDDPTQRVFDKLIKEFCETVKNCSDEQLECKNQKATSIRKVCLKAQPLNLSPPLTPISDKCKDYLRALGKVNFVQSLLDLTTSDKVNSIYICTMLNSDFLVKNAHLDVLSSCGIPEDENLKDYIKANWNKLECDKKLSKK